MSKSLPSGKRLKAVAADSCQLLNSPSTRKDRIRLPMKQSLRIIPFLICAAAQAHSQDELSSVLPEAANAVESRTITRILGEIPDGTPPAPEPPKPRFEVPTQDIVKSQSVEQGGRTVTVQEIKPIALPPPPPVLALPSAELTAEFQQRLETYREENPHSGLLFLGATVFRAKDSSPLTLVHYWPEGAKELITLWSSADFALVAGGINSFTDASGESNHLLMSWGNVELDRMVDLADENVSQYDAPPLPEFALGKASFQIIGPKAASEDLVPIQALHDLYNEHFDRLKLAFEGRERARLQQEAELKANPPKPKNITLNYWRTETPASTTGGSK